MKDAEMALQRSRDNQLYINQGKCGFGAEVMYFLGFKVSQGTLMPEEEKVKAYSKNRNRSEIAFSCG